MFGYDRSAIEMTGLADPPDGMGRDLQDATLFVTSPDRPLMTGSEYLRFLLIAALVHGGLLHPNYFLLVRTIPLHPSDRPFPGRQRC